MLNYSRSDVSEGTHVNKTRLFRECIIWHHWYVLDRGFRFETPACNGCP